ncbi:MAG: hypothetical protein WBQ87_14790 [Candidatus Sulfotelmatobacter sp.]
MKTTIIVFCLLCATAAFGQNGPILNNNATPVVMTEHPQRASEHALAPETSLLSGMSPYTYAKGEVPLAELGSLPCETPLGDVARAYRKEHAEVPKATIVLDK